MDNSLRASGPFCDIRYNERERLLLNDCQFNQCQLQKVHMKLKWFRLRFR